MKKKISFETAMNRLDSIVDKLENGNESLENSLKLFEEGTKIAAFCYSILNNAEQKVVQLSQLEKIKSVKNEDASDEQ